MCSGSCQPCSAETCHVVLSHKQMLFQQIFHQKLETGPSFTPTTKYFQTVPPTLATITVYHLFRSSRND